MKRSIILMTVAMIALIGCAPRYIWRSEPESRSVSNVFFDAMILPVFVSGAYGGYKAFAISIKNKTRKNIEINWNKTLFINNGQTSGGFMFPGAAWAQRDNFKLPDIVFPNVEFAKGLMPNDLVRYTKELGGWWHESMSSGVNGVYLTVIVDGKEINETLTVRLSYTDLRK